MSTSTDARQMLRERSQSMGAVILAGGLARRMAGQDKGLILLAGKPLVHYALAAVLPAVDRCVINANRNHDLYERIAASEVSMLHSAHPFLPSVQVVSDTLEGHLGPLAGLSAGIETLDSDYIFMCPCDSPFLQPELVNDLLLGCLHADADMAVAHDGERLQPVFCVVNRRVKASLDAFLASGQRKIDRWFAEHDMNAVNAADYSASFVNINTEEDRAEAEKVLLA